MKDRTVYYMIETSAGIRRSLIWWSAVMVASIISLPYAYQIDSVFLFGASVTGFIVAGIAIALNIMMISGLNNHMPDDTPPAPPDDTPDPADYLTWDQAHQPQEIRIEALEGNTIRLGRYKLQQSDWAALAESLHDYGWRWTRDAVADSGVFTSLSSKFAGITEDMAHLGVIRGGARNWEVEPQWRLWFVEQSPNLYLEHMR